MSITKKLKLDQLKTGALLSYFTMALSMIAGLLYTPWMVSKIGQSDYGLYTLATSLISFFMLDFGLGSAVSRYVSKYRAEGRFDAISNILGVIYKLYLIIDLIIFLALAVAYCFLDVIYAELTPAELEKFRTFYIIVAVYYVIAFPFAPLDGTLIAFEKFAQLKLCTLLYRVYSVLAVVVVLLFSSDVRIIILATVSSHLVAVLSKLFFVKKHVRIRINFRAGGRDIYRSLFSFTLWTTIIGIAQRFTHSFAPSVLGITSGSAEISLYSPAVLLEGYFFSLGTAVNGFFLPRISTYIANKTEHKISNLMIKVGRYQAFLLGLIFIGFVCIGKEFMTLWMGETYTKSYYLTIILLVPTLFSVTQQIAKTTVLAKKLIKYEAICMTVTGLLGLAVSYLLSIKLGATGVCIGTMVAGLANCAYMNFIYHKKIGINMFAFYKQCYLRLIPCYGVALLLSFAVLKLIPLSGWIGLGVKAIAVGIVFVVVMLVCYTTKEEKQMLLGFVKKLRREN